MSDRDEQIGLDNEPPDMNLQELLNAKSNNERSLMMVIEKGESDEKKEVKPVPIIGNPFFTGRSTPCAKLEEIEMPSKMKVVRSEKRVTNQFPMCSFFQ